MYIFLILFYAIFFTWACGYVAESKGKDKGAWMILGFLFGVFALLVIGLTSPNDTVSHSKDIYETRKCPFCAEVVKAEALICRFCNRDLPKLEKEEKTNQKSPQEILESGNCPQEIYENGNCPECGASRSGEGGRCAECQTNLFDYAKIAYEKNK